ncbi:MAG: hypothetical protein M0009_17095 [Deltaproteobacteria bacterium]|nr:hypothetical protein [Deltaproteobacteria bacterium]
MMIVDVKDHRFAVDNESAQGFKGEAASLPLRLFRHRDLLSAINAAPVIKQRELINTLHYIHFTNGSILVHITDPKYAEDFLIRCRIESCQAKEVRCLWPEGVSAVSDKGRLLHLIMEDGLSLLLFPILLTGLDEKGFSMALPEAGRLLGKRRIRRHACHDVTAHLMQNGLSAVGELLNFTPQAFQVHITPSHSISFSWVNIDEPFTICFRKGERVIFSGSCRCLRQRANAQGWDLVLEPQRQEIRRFQKRKIRNPRLGVTPRPSAHFNHPLFDKAIHRDIRNLTFSGFSVEEEGTESVLLPGMIIHGLEIRYAGGMKMTCHAQVIYRRPISEGRVSCGLAILDMDFRNYSRLGHIVVHTTDSRACISNEVEMDALWEFFFSTGFIYPKKYALLQSSKEAFKKTYCRLYRGDPDIATHFTYEENGKIYGHMSIFRAYQRTWMVHHLAARPLQGKRTGLSVIKNTIRFFDGLHRFPSIGINHLIFYYRPENGFPNLFCGGFAKDINNPQICSLDLFAYQNYERSDPSLPLPKEWQLTNLTPGHYAALERFYRTHSGGLLLDVLRLDQTTEGEEPLSMAYQRQGFLRQCSAYALTYQEELKAVLIVNRSDFGFNLSELLNGIKIIVTDSATLPWKILTSALSQLMSAYPTETVPLLIYPAEYPAEQKISIDKRYYLWALDVQHGPELMKYSENKSRLLSRFLFKYLWKRLLSK